MLLTVLLFLFVIQFLHRYSRHCHYFNRHFQLPQDRTNFLPRDATQSAVSAWQVVCPSVRLYVCL